MYEYEVQYRVSGSDRTLTAMVTLSEQCHSGNSTKLLTDAISRQHGGTVNNIYSHKFLGKK